MQRFQILSLDGGGIRGLYSAAVLANLEETYSVNVTDHFDLITGTSTGGIIALGLGLGMRPRDIVHFYTENGPQIFKNPFWLRSLLHWVGRKYNPNPLYQALRDDKTFGDKILADSKCRLVIPSYNLGQDKVRLFKTPHHADFKTDWNIPVWQVAAATSAAPTFFPAFRDYKRFRLIDGGVWANNPVVVGITEAVGILGYPLSAIHALSFGTTEARVKRGKLLDIGGKLPWVYKSNVIEILMRGQSIGTNGLARHLLGKENFCRIDASVPVSLEMDKIQEDELITEAGNSALNDGPTINKHFFTHRAAPYTPIYTAKKDAK